MRFLFAKNNKLNSKKCLLRPDLKICWFAVTRPGLQETRESQNFFLMFIHEKKFFNLKHIINKDYKYYK